MAQFRNSKNTDKQVSQLKVPPHSIEAEQSVLGGLMLDAEAWDRVSEAVTKEDFYSRAHQMIFEAMATLVEGGQPLDLITVSESLELNQLLEDAGGFAYLAEIAKNTPSASNIVSYADIVRERAVVRDMIKVANDIADAGFNPEGRDSAQLLDLAESKVFKIAESRGNDKEGPENIKSILDKTVDRIEKLYSNPHNGVTGVSSGYNDLDKMTAGLQPSDLIIVAARPSMGKCIVAGSKVLNPETGQRQLIDDLVKDKTATIATVTEDYKIQPARASEFVDDGLKPVFKVTTALGRTVTTTITHPFLTGAGWQPLANIKVGEQVAIPRELNFFGEQAMAEHEVKMLAYMIADGGTTQTNPMFTNVNPEIAADFSEAATGFAGIKVTKVSDDSRADSYRLAKSEDQTEQYRTAFAQLLSSKLADAKMTARDLAGQLDVNSSSVSYWLQGAYVPELATFEKLCRLLSIELAEHGLPEYSTLAKNSQNSVTQFLQQHQLWGKTALEKTIPAVIETLPKSQMALFVNRLFACDGSAFVQANGQARLSYSSSSQALISSLQHLLIRFGIIAKVRSKTDKAYELEVMDQDSIKSFIKHIGIVGKQQQLDEVLANLEKKQPHTNKDLLPVSVNQYILALKGEQSWREIFTQAGKGYPEGYNPHLVGNSTRALSRSRAKEFAALFNDKYLQQMADSALYWDQIVSIESLGEQQVYDLTVPDTHNFIAEDICVHNTTFAMNLCEYAALNEDKPVLIFSLEMPSEQIMMRMLASLGRINQTNIRTGQLDDEDWARVSSTMGLMLEQGKMYIDDSSGLTPTEVRSRARRIAREHGGLSMIMIDYLQLMQVPGLSDNRTLEIAEISRSLKALAKELQVPVVALSQLNRSLEQRADKRPVNSDLRESGSIEQDADLIMFIYRDEVYNDDSAEKGVAEIIIGKQRNGPIGRVRLQFVGQFSRFDNYTGVDYDDEY